MKEKIATVVDHFEIPEELAKELSMLLTKQVIRERLLSTLLSDPDKYEQAESLLIPITSRIESIKLLITQNNVPAKYNSRKYSWNYEGWEISGNNVQIIEEI